LDNEKTFSGILLTFVSAGFVGILFVVYLLPFFAHRVTHAVYDSAEMIERDVMHDARSLLAQGDYAGAIEAFKQAAAAEPTNRLPWVEIAKIQRDHLGDPTAALATFRSALDEQDWEIEDAAFFLFRLVDMYDEVMGDRETAIGILKQAIEEFPDTRHSANARVKLQHWGVGDFETATAVQPVPPPPAALQAASSDKDGQGERDA
jgi:tetratricopeptide (TPR) repeat protein